MIKRKIKVLIVLSFFIFAGVLFNNKVHLSANEGTDNYISLSKKNLVDANSDGEETFTVFFDIGYSSGVNPENQVVISGEKVTEPTIDEREGHLFSGWYLDDELYDFDSPVLNNLTLIAKWEEVVYNITYVLYFDEPNDPIAFDPFYKTFTINSNFELETPDDRQSSVFVGWFSEEDYSGGKIESIQEGLSEDLIVYAKWEVKTYTVNFYVDGELYDSLTVEHSNLIENFPDDPTHANLNFIGWRDELDNHINEQTPINRDMVLIPAFGDVVVVTFIDSLLGDFEKVIPYGDQVFKPVLTKPGYLFLGWFVDDELFDFDLSLYEDISLTAKWRNLIEEAQIELRDYLENYIKDVVEKDHLNDLIDSLINEVDENNYDLLEDLKISNKAILLNEEKEHAKALINDYIILEDIAYPSVLTLQDEYELLINAEEDINEVINYVSLFKDEAIILGKYEKAVILITEQLDLYIEEVREPTVHLTDALESLIAQVTLENYGEILSIIEDSKIELLNLEKAYAADALEAYEPPALDMPTSKIDSVKDAYLLLINDEDDINAIKDILDEAIIKINVQVVLDNLYSDLFDRYTTQTTDEKHYYDEAGLAQIQTIYEDVKLKYLNDLISEEELLDKLAALDDIAIRYSDNLARIDGDLTPAEGELNGYATSKNGFEEPSKLVIKLEDLDSSNKDKILKFIQEKKLVHKFGTKTKDQLYEEMKNKVVDAQLDIALLSKASLPIVITDDEIEVYIMLPSDLLAKENLQIVYLKEDGLEVFDIKIEGKFVKFKTDHFSNFYLISGSEEAFIPPVDINLWWVITVLLIVAVVLLVMIILTHRKNKQMIVRSALLPIIFNYSPKGAVPIIIVLVVFILLEGIFLIHLNRKDKIEEELILEEDALGLEPEVKLEPQPEVKAEPKPKVVVPIVKPKTKTRTINNYSFKARLHLADEETADRYNELKNHILNYAGTSNNLSWRQETFTARGKMVVKLRLQGRTMRVYLGVNPANFVDSKYNIEDVSTVKTHRTTPSLMRVQGPGNLRHVMELIDLWMEENDVVKDKNYQIQNYKEKPLEFDKLVELGLIRVQSANFITKAEKK